MKALSDVHQQFALFFKDKNIQPFLYLLSKRMMEGHICLNLQDEQLKEELTGTFFENSLMDVSSLLASKDYVSSKLEDNRPLIIHNNKLYLHRYFFYETEIISRIEIAVRNSEKLKKDRQDFLKCNESFIKDIALNTNSDGWAHEEKPDWQLTGALQAFINNFAIITGGPGTGKTTTVAKVLSLIYKENPEVNVALAAPTGKAAMRMKESLSSNENLDKWGIKSFVTKLKKPVTIHKLLGVNKNSPYFKRNQDNKLEEQVVIIDESSMIGTALFAKLLDAINFEKTRLILLGDANQLASVDAGSLFGDICLTQDAEMNFLLKNTKDFINSFLNENHKIPSDDFGLKTKSNILNEHIIELKKTFRFDVNSKVGKFTKAVINSEWDTVKDVINLPDKVLVIDSDYENFNFESFAKEYTGFIQEKDIKEALNKLNKVRVLCAVKQSKEGVYHNNERIEKYLKNHFDDLARKENGENNKFNPSNDFYHNQPIIVTKNYDDLGLFNGDIGIIRKTDDGKLKAFFIDEDEKLKAISPGFISECETVFAMTIHKSQGSEFDKVLVILPKKTEVKILTRELIYTAVTRAKTKPGMKDTAAIIQGPEDVLKSATLQKVKRTSGITERIKLIV